MKRLIMIVGFLSFGLLCTGGKTVGRVDIEEVNISTDLKELKKEFETFKEVAKNAK